MLGVRSIPSCIETSKILDYLPEVVSARVNEARCQNLACRADFFSACKWGFKGKPPSLTTLDIFEINFTVEIVFVVGGNILQL